MFRIFNVFRSVTLNMSSLTVTVSGTDTSNLTCNFFPPLDLTGEWYVGLLDFTSYNSIPNVIENVNNEFPVFIDDVWKVIKLPTGAYEITDIEKYLKKELGLKKIILRPNNSTLKCELTCKYTVDFSQSAHSIGATLGFINNTSLAPNITHESDSAVNIIKVNTVQVHCNIVQGAYTDRANEHTLHSFYPIVEPGFKIVEKPTTVIYLPVNVRRVDKITISLHDQNGEIVNFRGESITVRLHLKRI